MGTKSKGRKMELQKNQTPRQDEPATGKKIYTAKLLKRNFSFSSLQLGLFGLVFAVVGAIIIFSSFAASPVTPTVSSSSDTSLLLRFKANATKSQRDKILHDNNLTIQKELPQIGVKVVSVPSVALSAVTNALSHNPAVDFVEQDQTLKPQEQLPNDPYFLNSGSWNLGGGAWGWYVTHTTQAWDITQGNPNVQIAVLDTGIKTNGLADFSGQISSTWNVMNNSTDATSGAGNHGTYVAGVVGLAIGNDVGNAGYCPLCKIMVVQVGTDSGATLSNIASGVTYAADHGAKVINLSWAGTADSSTMQSAINYAHNKGLVIFAAAGNSNCDCKAYPAGDQNVLGVGGVSDAAGNKQGDSNFGSWVQIAAPEGNLTAWPTINGAPGYAPVGGTSVASPAAAGIAGLLFSYNPNLTNTQVEQTIENTSVPVNFTLAHGRIDALAALQSLGAADQQPSSPPVQTAAPHLYSTLSGADESHIVSLSGAPQVGQTLVRGIGGWTGSYPLSVATGQWQRCDTAGNNCVFVNASGYYTIQSADAGSTIKLNFSVKNNLGSVAQSLLTSVVGGSSSTPAPTVSLSASPSSIIAGQSSTLTWSSTNATSCTATGGWSGTRATSGSLAVSPTSNSTYTLTCTGAGGSASSSATVLVAPATMPPATPAGLAPTPLDSSVTLTWNANTEADLAGYQLQYKPTAGSTWTQINNITGLTDTVTGLTNGTGYDFQLRAVNTSGQVSAWTATVSATPQGSQPADTTAPTVTINSPANGASIAGQKKVNISASASDNNVVIKIELYIDGALKTTVTTPNLSYTWSINRNVKAGSHTITVKAYDAAGNVGQSSVIVTK
jgi:thermitase